MKSFLIYYILTLAFYLVEIITFVYLYSSWQYDVFWLNLTLRLILVLIFSIVISNLIFATTKYFYVKFSVLVLCNPFLSSVLLKLFLLSLLSINVLILKFVADLITSIFIFYVLKKIA